jgi:hypothetical protein
MKKRDNLFELIKKDKEYNLMTFLDPQDLLELSLLSKKYYAQLVSTLEVKRLDKEQLTKQTKSKPQKSKPTKAKPEP